MEIKQNGLCAICKTSPEITVDKNGRHSGGLRVDHDHDTGVIRGLLCRNCNSGLGYFKDNKQIMENAVKYLDDKALHVEDVIDFSKVVV